MRDIVRTHSSTMVDVPDTLPVSPSTDGGTNGTPAAGRGHVSKMISLFSNGFVVRINGSDPSLASRNGKSQASGQVLHSGDENTHSHSKSSLDEVDNVKTNYVTSRILTIEGSTEDVDPSKLNHVSSKEPSYVNISRSVSGYKRTNSQHNDVNRNSPSLDRNNVILGRLNRDSASPGAVCENGLALSNSDSCLQNGHVDVTVNGHDTDTHVHSQSSNGAIHPQDDQSPLTHDALHVSADRDGSTERDVAVIKDKCSDCASPGFQQVELVAPSDSTRKNGEHFLRVVNGEEKLLQKRVDQVNHMLETTDHIPDEAEGMIRATLGKSNLLITNKFIHYRQFCHKNLHPEPGESRITTDEDLAGLWDIVYLQIQDVHTMFDQIQSLKQNSWKPPTVEQETTSSPAKSRVTKPSHTRRSKPTTPKDSSQSSDAAKAREQSRNKAREEAKKRLLAAKKAGRQRKASQSEDVEIFVQT